MSKYLLAPLLIALAAIASLAFSPLASAAPLITVTPYENLSTSSPTVVTVSGSGLMPNTNVAIRQVAMNYVEESGFTGTRVEQAHKAVATTDAQGSFSVNVSVQYDVRTDLVYSDFCQNSTELRRLCYLHVQYQLDSGLGEVIGQPKLYFGTAGPVVAPELPGNPTSPVAKDECYQNGWQSFGSMFTNQGSCVSYVASSNRKSE